MRNPTRTIPILGTTAAACLLAVFAASCGSRGKAPAVERMANTPGKFVWHDLNTGDPKGSKRFYGELLGWEFTDSSILGHDYTVARVGGRPIGGIHTPPRDDSGKTPAHWLSYMSVADVDASVKTVTDSGGGVLAGPLNLDMIGRAAVVRDSQGAPFGLVRLKGGDPVDPPAPIEGAFFWNEYLTRDLDGTLKFYQALAPYEATTAKTEGTASYVVLKNAAARAGVFRVPDSERDVPPNWLPYVLVSDPAALAARVPQLGGKVLLAPKPEFRNASLAVVADPSGAVVALQKYPY
jgi:predicted enzyme related to lactoylglutathione lyase